MLVLGRNLGDSIVINDNIQIRFIKGSKDDLKVAIEAPKNVRIMRGEVWEAERKARFLEGEN